MGCDIMMIASLGMMDPVVGGPNIDKIPVPNNVIVACVQVKTHCSLAISTLSFMSIQAVTEEDPLLLHGASASAHLHMEPLTLPLHIFVIIPHMGSFSLLINFLIFFTLLQVHI